MDRATSPGERFTGAIVLHGLEGFGAHSRIHTAKILRLSEDLPLVIEIVDTFEKIEAFLPLIDDAIKRRSGHSGKSSYSFLQKWRQT